MNIRGFVHLIFILTVDFSAVFNPKKVQEGCQVCIPQRPVRAFVAAKMRALGFRREMPPIFARYFLSGRQPKQITAGSLQVMASPASIDR